MASSEDESEFRQFAIAGTTTLGIEGAALASGTNPMVPTHGLHRVTGNSQLTLIALPYPGFAGSIRLHPADAFTGATGGVATAVNKPIGKAFTAVADKTLTITYFPSLGLWYPDYVA